MGFLFFIKQGEPEIERHHGKKSEAEHYYVNGKFVAKDRDYEIYSTTLSITCEILLYHMGGPVLIAKSIDTFSQKKERKEADVFSSHTLFGFIEDVFDAFETAPGPHDQSDAQLSHYPTINHLDAYKVKKYFYTFMRDLERK